MRTISLEQAKSRYPHRYTMEHRPAWAAQQCGNGKYYAPQFRTDLEWYENTTFPGEGCLPKADKHCETSGQTWPLVKWLDQPYKRSATL